MNQVILIWAEWKICRSDALIVWVYYEVFISFFEFVDIPTYEYVIVLLNLPCIADNCFGFVFFYQILLRNSHSKGLKLSFFLVFNMISSELKTYILSKSEPHYHRLTVSLPRYILISPLILFRFIDSLSLVIFDWILIVGQSKASILVVPFFL